MAFTKAPIFIILFLITLLPISTNSQDPSSDLLLQLESLQSQSPKSGVIHLTDSLLKRILSIPTHRPCTFLVFFDAQQLHSKPELSFPSLKSEFSLVSKSFLANNPPTSHSKLFFDIEFQESQSFFALFGVNSLPHTDVKKDSIQINASDFSRLAESMAEFVKAKTKLSIGPIDRPSLISKKQLMFLIAVILIRLHSWGSGMQLGAKGFAVGFLYTVVGLLLAFVTHVLVYVRNRNAQRLDFLLTE